MCRATSCTLTTIYLCDVPACLNRNEQPIHAFCLASGRVCPLYTLLCIIVRSYRTFSPLLIAQFSLSLQSGAQKELFLGLERLFSVALSVSLRSPVLNDRYLYFLCILRRYHVHWKSGLSSRKWCIYARLSCIPRILIINEKLITNKSIALIRIIV